MDSRNSDNCYSNNSSRVTCSGAMHILTAEVLKKLAKDTIIQSNGQRSNGRDIQHATRDTRSERRVEYCDISGNNISPSANDNLGQKNFRIQQYSKTRGHADQNVNDFPSPPTPEKKVSPPSGAQRSEDRKITKYTQNTNKNLKNIPDTNKSLLRSSDLREPNVSQKFYTKYVPVFYCVIRRLKGL